MSSPFGDRTKPRARAARSVFAAAPDEAGFQKALRGLDRTPTLDEARHAGGAGGEGTERGARSTLDTQDLTPHVHRRIYTTVLYKLLP